jgi:hypothetical protein
MLLELPSYLQSIPNMFQPTLDIFKEFSLTEVEVLKVHSHSFESDIYINLEYQLKSHSAWLKRYCFFFISVEYCSKYCLF